MALSNNVRNKFKKGLCDGDTAKALCDALDAATVGVANSYKDQVHQIPIEDLAAGADIAARPVWATPLAGQIVSIGVLAVGSYVGVDAGNTMVFDITTAAAASIVSKTFNAVTIPTNNGFDDLGALDATNKILAANAIIKMALTNGATANPPGLFLIIRFRPDSV